MGGEASADGNDDLLVAGAGHLSADLSGCALTVFTYVPHSEPRGCLLLFSGLGRNARQSRDDAVGIADRAGLTVFAPLMNEADFPMWRYNRAGLVRRRELQPPERWTAPVLQSLVDWVQHRRGKPSLPTYLLGFSAGGQLLSRVCAYTPLARVTRFVICSPSVYTAPTMEKRVPFGFRGIFQEEQAEQCLRRYLAAPITIYLGTHDTGNRLLAASPQALWQGVNRLDRGRHMIQMAIKLAEQKNWITNWRLVEAAGIGHSMKGMLEAPECGEALCDRS